MPYAPCRPSWLPVIQFLLFPILSALRPCAVCTVCHHWRMQPVLELQSQLIEVRARFAVRKALCIAESVTFRVQHNVIEAARFTVRKAQGVAEGAPFRVQRNLNTLIPDHKSAFTMWSEQVICKLITKLKLHLNSINFRN